MSFVRYPEYKDSGVDWLGQVPAHWALQRIKHITTSFEQGWSPQCEGFPGGRDEWSVLKVGCVNGGNFNRDENKVLPAELTPLPELGLKVDDLLISRANTRELVGSAAVVLEDDAKLLLCDKLFRLRFDAALAVPRFVCSYLATHNARGQIELAATGASASMVNIGQSAISELLIPLPSASEQTAIAAFLDRETGKIDALVAEQQKLIALLKEKRQAVINHAVTKGLSTLRHSRAGGNPEPGTAPLTATALDSRLRGNDGEEVAMKPSGIEWLGDVPAHWEVIALGKITLDKCDGPFGSGLKSEHYRDEGVRVVRLQNIRMGNFDGTDAAYVDEAYQLKELVGHDVCEGDVLIAGLGDDKNTVGRACVAPPGIEPAMVKADCFRFRLVASKADAVFVAMALTAGAHFDAGMLSSGSTRSRIPLSVMASRKIGLPPMNEQHAINLYADKCRYKFDELIDTAVGAIDRLKERRSALISAAVTGQIDVRGLAGAVGDAALKAHG